MDHFDDIQVEDHQNFDFCFDGIFDEDEDDRTFNAFLNSNWDF